MAGRDKDGLMTIHPPGWKSGLVYITCNSESYEEQEKNIQDTGADRQIVEVIERDRAKKNALRSLPSICGCKFRKPEWVLT